MSPTTILILYIALAIIGFVLFFAYQIRAGYCEYRKLYQSHRRRIRVIKSLRSRS